MSRSIIRLTIVISCFVLLPLVGIAQDITQNEYTESFLSSMFENLEVDRVPTGYLLDRAFEAANVRLYNGTSLSDSNYVDIPVFRNILLTMNSAKVNNNGSLYNANDITDSLADTLSIKMGCTLFKYNYIKSSALSNNLISYQNGKVYDVYDNGIWQNPYETSVLFAVTPNIPAVFGTSVRFTLSQTDVYGNLTPVKWEFDAGNGGGYTTITLPFDSTIQFNSTGEKEIKMRITLSDQTVMESHSLIQLFPRNMAPSIDTRPDNTRSFLGLYEFERVAANVSYKVGSMNNGIIKRPLIYVEGFDISILSTLNQLLNDYLIVSPKLFESVIKAIFNSSYGSLGFSDLYNSCSDEIKNYYDVFYVDWLTPLADIKANAGLLKDIINWINNQKDSATGERNIVFGHSMGGLIARYALRTMEISGVPHQTSYYVSHDSPHLGANVPIGAIHFVRDVYKLLYGSLYNFNIGILDCHLFDFVVYPFIDILESTAARQMLYNYVNRNGVIDNSVHNSWLNELACIGFPEGDTGFPIENLAIVNGMEYPSLSTLQNMLFSLDMHVGNNFIGWQQSALHAITRLNNLDASFNVYRHHGGSQLVSKSTASYRKVFPWIGEVKIQLIRDSMKYATGSIGLDYVDASTVLDSLIHEYYDNHNDYVQVDFNGPVFFIPTASALASPDYSKHFYQYPPVPLTETPFYSYYLNYPSISSHSHTSLYNNMFDWLLNQKQLEITSPSGLMLTGDSLAVSGGITPTANKSWYTSDASIATANNDTVTVHSPGRYVTVSYWDHNGSSHYYKHKRVLAGFPDDMFLKKVTDNSGATLYIIAQSPDTEINDYLDELVAKGEIYYEWGVQTHLGGSIQWSQSNSRYFVPSSGAMSTVFMRIVRGNKKSDALFVSSWGGAVPPLYSNPFYCEPDIIYTYYGDVWMNYTYFSDPVGVYYNPISGQYEHGPSYYFVAWHNPLALYSNTPDPDRIIINGQTIPISVTLQQSFYGTTTNMFCFDILSSSYIQSIITHIDNYPANTTTVSGTIYSGNTFLQNFSITITKTIPLL